MFSSDPLEEEADEGKGEQRASLDGGKRKKVVGEGGQGKVEGALAALVKAYAVLVA